MLRVLTLVFPCSCHEPDRCPDPHARSYAVELTRYATKITPEHHQRLRAAGFDDQGILQITLIASWFNDIDCVADALGVGRA